MRPQRIDDTRWRLPRTGGMRVDGIIYADERLMEALRQDQALEQVATDEGVVSPGGVGYDIN
jgi:tRNA-splicing ligase RtcB